MGNSWKNLQDCKLLTQLESNFGGMITSWVSFRILSDDLICQPRWLPQPNLVLHRPIREIYEKKSSWLDLLPTLALYFVEIHKKIFSHLKLSLVKWALDGFLSELYRASANQDGWLSQTCLCYLNQCMVDSNGFNVKFILETLWQVSDDRLPGASFFTVQTWR